MVLAASAWGQTPLPPYTPPLPNANSSFGQAIATGDFDGDGLTDVAIGAPADNTALPGAGAVYVFMGNGSAQTILSPSPTGLYGSFGWSLAAGNLHPSGADELVVGAPGELDPNSNLATGLHHVFTFAGAAWIPLFTGTSWANQWTGQQLGYSVTVLPHPINVGQMAWAASSPGGPAVGATAGLGFVDVFAFNAATGLFARIQMAVGPTIGGRCPGGMARFWGIFEYGRTIVGGDFNGDGLGDFAATYQHAAFQDTSTCRDVTNRGRGFHTLPSNGVAPPFNFTAPLDDFRVNQSACDPMALAGPGDVDGDGASDLAFGDWVDGDNNPVHPGGYAAFHSPLTGTTLSIFKGNDNTNDAMGKVLGVGGDVNGDGRPDLISRSRDAVHWVSNGDTRYAQNYPVTFGAQNLPVNYYASLAIGDVNNDGWMDVLAGDPANDTVTVTSPGDPAATLSTLNNEISVTRGGTVSFYIRPPGTLLDGTSRYYMLASLEKVTDPSEGYELMDQSVLMISPYCDIFQTSLAYPFSIFDANLGRINATSRTQISRIAVAPMNPLNSGDRMYAGYAIVNFGPLNTHSATDPNDIAEVVVVP